MPTLSILIAAVLAQPTLEDGFRDPPAVARPHTWWHWMNGNVSRAGITADLEAMKAAGLGGAQIFNPSENIPEGPVAYNSPQWRELVVFAAKEADRLGLELCFHNCAGWSSSGGPWVKPEHAMQTVVFSETKVKGGAKVKVDLPQPRTVAGYYKDIAVLAFPTPASKAADEYRIPDIANKAMYGYAYGLQPAAPANGLPKGVEIPRDQIVDLTGKQEWDAPEGNWTIVRFGHTPTGAVNAPSPASGRGLEVDKMSREAFDAFWAGGVAPLLKDAGPLVGKSLRNCLVDSYEVGSQNWTPRFREEFKNRRGYDMLPMLLVMTGRVVGGVDESERFLWDLRRTVGDLFADNYYSYFSEKCRQVGMISSVEPYDGPFECTQVARDADIVMGEFWTNGGMSVSCKLASSVAHTFGKPIAGAESFTAFPEVGKWMNTPANLKAVGDLMYTVGINRYIIHRYAHQPWTNVEPGMTMGQWGTHLERTTTWWPQAHAWFDYLARCQFMLQQGRFAADALVLSGEAAPNGTPTHDELKAAGYDYDVCGAEILLKRTSVKDGLLTLDSGMTYRLLVLPDTTFMTPELLAKIKDLVAAGATVVGPRPTRSPSLKGQPAADSAVAALAAELWDDCDGVKVKSHPFGSGAVHSGVSPLEVLHAIAPPDFGAHLASGGPCQLAWIHRTVGDNDIYFISNQKARALDVVCSFRGIGKSPRLAHAENGKIEDAAVWSFDNSRTAVPIRLEPAGSVFVILSRTTKTTPTAPTVASIKPPVDEKAPKIPAVVVTKAVYEAVDGAGGVDVTKKVAEIIETGEFAVPASNSLFGDPTYNHVKRLRVEYTVDGTPKNVTAAENTTARLIDVTIPYTPPAYRVRATAKGRELIAFTSGTYTLLDAKGRPSKLDTPTSPAAKLIAGPWSVKFQPGRGAPESIKLDALASLSKHDTPGVRYFSGTATYETTFELGQLPAGVVAELDLGGVRDLAEVSLNGHDLGVWWRPPFAADVTSHLKPGTNTLTIRVTNTWVNRLIGDEQFADDCEWNGITIKAWPKWFDASTTNPLANRPAKDRLTFTTWKHWHKGDQLPDSGLLGPATIRFGQVGPLP